MAFKNEVTHIRRLIRIKIVATSNNDTSRCTLNELEENFE